MLPPVDFPVVQFNPLQQPLMAVGNVPLPSLKMKTCETALGQELPDIDDRVEALETGVICCWQSIGHSRNLADFKYQNLTRKSWPTPTGVIGPTS